MLNRVDSLLEETPMLHVKFRQRIKHEDLTIAFPPHGVDIQVGSNEESISSIAWNFGVLCVEVEVVRGIAAELVDFGVVGEDPVDVFV